jgi:hypothetical protein
VTFTLTGSAVFTSSSSYFCTANGATAAIALEGPFSFAYTSGTSFTVSTSNLVAKAFRFICVGN